MTNNTLYARIHEDHEKLDRVFTSLESTLRSLAETPETETAQVAEYIQDARDDLSFALEEMLEHFGIEEEAIFDLLSTHLPDTRAQLRSLEEGHEILCKRTSRLRKMVAAAQAEAAPLDIPVALKIISDITRLLRSHNQREVALFSESLERLDEGARAELMHALENHG